jgi:DNA-binding protein YbaB
VSVADGGLGAAGLDRLLADTRRALAAAQGGMPASGEPLEGVGTAHDDQVRATVRAPGRLTALDLNPRVMRLASEELSEHIIAAVNAALDDLRTRATAAVPAGEAAPDLGALGGQLAELHTESIRQMERITSAVQGAIEQIRSRGA